MRTAIFLVVALALGGCNDLTEPHPAIAGEYAYSANSADFPTHNRRGSIQIIDDDRRTARFDGTYEYIRGDGVVVHGRLVGAFMPGDSLWFRFLDDRFEYHEAEWNGRNAVGEIFFQILTYEPSGSTFSLNFSGNP